MDDLTECNLDDGNFDWDDETMVTVMELAQAGNSQAKKELAKREKQLGITSIATLSGNSEESNIFYA